MWSASVFGPRSYETDHPGVQKYEKIWEKSGTGEPFSNFALYGMAVGELTVICLEMAGQDLTRGSFLDAAESECDFWCSNCDGIGPLNMSPTDHRPIEGRDVQQGRERQMGDLRRRD